MENISFKEAVDRLVQADPRYSEEAYYFIRDGLDHTVKQVKNSPGVKSRHVTGGELAAGLSDFALDEYGPMALFTLNSWGIRQTEDFGELVFALIDAGKLGKTEEDKKEDFAGLFNLAKVLEKPYEVAEEPRQRRPRRS